MLFCALLGLPAGWFAGVLVDRIPDKQSLLRPFPAPRFDVLHLAILLGTVGLFALTGARFDTAPVGELAVVLVVFTSLMALSVIDIQIQRLPDRIVAPTYVLVMSGITWVSVANDQPERIRYALIGGGMWVLILGVGWLVGMGFGDVKAGGVMGLAVGWMGLTGPDALTLVLWSLILGTVSASIYGVVAKLVQTARTPRSERKRLWFAFGPFLAVGTMVVVLFSTAIV